MIAFMHKFLLAAVAAISLSPALSPSAASTAEFAQINDNTLLISGDIMEGDALRFATFTGEALARGQGYKNVLLNSPGGLVGEGVRLSKLIRFYEMNTGIARDDSCVSICALMFSAGVERWMSGGGSLGVHSVATLDQTETERSRSITLELGRLMVEYGASPIVIGKMATVTGNDIAWLGYEDLTSWVHVVK